MSENILRNIPLANINPWSFCSIGLKIQSLVGDSIFQAASTAYPAQNLATYIPFSANAPMAIKNAFSYNGATVRGNMDIGIFFADGTRINSTGPIQQSGTSVLQTVNVNWNIPGPGVYWMGIAMSSGSATTLFAEAMGQVAYCTVLGIMRQASAYPLPKVAVMSPPQNDFVPAFGISTLQIF